MCQIHCALGCRTYLLVLCEEGAFSGFLLPSCPLLSTVCQWGGTGTRVLWGGGSWLDCQVLPAISAVYI